MSDNTGVNIERENTHSQQQAPYILCLEQLTWAIFYTVTAIIVSMIVTISAIVGMMLVLSPTIIMVSVTTSFFTDSDSSPKADLLLWGVWMCLAMFGFNVSVLVHFFVFQRGTEKDHITAIGLLCRHLECPYNRSSSLRPNNDTYEWITFLWLSMAATNEGVCVMLPILGIVEFHDNHIWADSVHLMSLLLFTWVWVPVIVWTCVVLRQRCQERKNRRQSNNDNSTIDVVH
jgi:hypothetical protein